jgi:hypothetical protein
MMGAKSQLSLRRLVGSNSEFSIDHRGIETYNFKRVFPGALAY